MLQVFRSSRSNIFVWVLIGLLIVALAGFGLGNAVSGMAGSAVAEVGDRTITPRRFVRAYQTELQRLRQMTGQATLTENQARVFGLDRQVIGQLLAAEALTQAAVDGGLSAGDLRVRDAIVANPGFQGLTGGFDAQAYDFTLSQLGMTTRDYEQTVRDELARDLLIESIASPIAMPDAAARTILAHEREVRTARYITLPLSRIPELSETPSDADLQSFLDDNADSYRTPERRRITAALVRPETLAAGVPVTDEDLQAEYDARLDEFQQPEGRILGRVVFPTEADAEAARALIEDGSASFSDIIAERGLAPSDADLGTVTATDLRGAARDGIFGSDEPGLFGPFDTDLGPALFQVNAVVPASSVSFEEARDGLRQEIALEEARFLVGDEVAAVEDALAAGATVESLATATALVLEEATVTAGQRSGLAGDPVVYRAAQRLAEGELTEVLDLSDGGIAVLRLDAIVAPALPDLDAIRDLVADDWAVAERQKALRAEADGFAARLSAGETFEAVAEDAGQSLAETGALTRDGAGAALPAPVIADLFDLADAGTLVAAAPDGGVLVVQLDEVQPFDPASEEGALRLEALSSALSGSIATDVVSTFAAGYQTQAGVRLNQSLLDATFTQLP